MSATRLLTPVALAEQRHARNARSAGVIAALLVVLAWYTRWPSLRPGLAVLIAGQAATVILLVRHSMRLSREVQRIQRESGSSAIPEGGDGQGWFVAEAGFVRRLMVVENSVRALGFVLVAYGFWQATGNVLIPVLLGVVYPVLAYFGIVRKKYRRTLRELEGEARQI